VSWLRGKVRAVIRIATSHRTEVLLEAFVERFVDERGREGPLAPVRVVVPNRNVETFLRLKIAEHCGVAANLETTFLRKFLARLAEGAVPDARVATAENVEGHLLALLHDDGMLGEPSLAHVRAYLAAAGGDRDALDRRRCQLAALLAQLFDEYAGSRPEILAEWAREEGPSPQPSPRFAGRGGEVGGRGDGVFDLPLFSRLVPVPSPLQGGGHEDWQRTLWRAVFGRDGRLARQASGIRYLSLEALWGEAMAKRPAPFAGQTLHVFGLSYIATAYHQMLATLARESTVHVYMLNPCRETEEELRAKPDLSTNDPFGLGREVQPVLRRWARPGRENLRLLAACPGVTVDARFSASADESATLLRRLQSDIVNRRVPEPTAAHSEADGSLRVLPCPSLRRELEVVAAEIWNLARRDPSLRLCDVAVIVPEASKDLYLAQISAVFGESCDLPHSVADLPAASAHRAAEAIELLLHLPFSSFTRKDLLPLVTHPCLMARFPKAEPEAWRELVHELGIVRGADHGDLAGSYVTRDLFTWDQGLRRLVLGALVDTHGTDEADSMVIGGEAYLPGPPLDSANEECLGLGLLVRSLIADARFASGGEKTAERLLGEWLDFIRALVESYLVLDQDDVAGSAVIAHFLAGLEDLADTGLGHQPVSYRVAAELAKRALAATPSSRGHYLSSGVTVASFVPMRAIPFRAVFVLGLGQDAFPRAAGRHELDLRAGVRKAGDVDRREQDLYMFLETLLSARDHVTLSYVARDEITGDELPASPVLLELHDILGHGYLDSAQIALLFCDELRMRPSLRRFDDTALRRAVLPAAEDEHVAKELGTRLAKDEPGAPRPNPLRASRGEGAEDPPTTVVIPLFALRRFLEDPLQGSARFRLRMRDDDERAPADVEDEPFDMDKRGSSWLLRTTMTDAILAAQAAPPWPDVLAAYERRSSRAELAGQSPTGLFRSARTQGEQEFLRAWHVQLQTVLGQRACDCRVVRLTPHAGQGQASKENPGVVYALAPSFTIALPGGPDLDVRIGGQTGLCAGDATLGFTCRAGISAKDRIREELGAFLDYVVLTAAGTESARPGHRSAVFFTQDGQGKVRTLDFRPLERQHAQDYLARLCADLMTGALDANGVATGVHPYLLPHEAVLASQHRQTPLVDAIDDLCAKAEDDQPSFSSLRGPVPRVLERYAAPAADEAERMAEARFGLFFELALELARKESP
jgi:exodeoxyribonuclease V gamma subunit